MNCLEAREHVDQCRNEKGELSPYKLEDLILEIYQKAKHEAIDDALNALLIVKRYA